ncbi:inhibitor of apoptosis protein-like [Littorina saxatilis]|uniref:RING-type domain-containing protein n=1 Tax=Littorina saxatilis TaxID=31220 RepID=A0AAN9BSJ1_9CAEN
MACVSRIREHQIADKGPGTKMRPEDRDLLQQPFAAALQDMGIDRVDLIVHAAKLLQSQNWPLLAPTVMLEVERLQEMEKRGQSLPLLHKPREHAFYGSHGESEAETVEHHDAKDDEDDDLQTDCAPLNVPSRATEVSDARPQVMEPIKATEVSEMRQPVSKKDEVPREATRKIGSGQDVESLKHKLQALRSENQRLKERHLCRHCRSKPVSLTFLPCGHYSYCCDCGGRFSACPICRKTILADVRTFLA